MSSCRAAALFTLAGIAIGTSFWQVRAQAHDPIAFKTDGLTVVHYSGSYALLIPVSTYDQWPELKSIPGEMQRLSSALLRSGFDISSLHETRPTKRDIELAVKEFVQKAGQTKDNRIFIVFTGHGYSFKNEAEEAGYFIPADTPDPDINPDLFRDRAIPVEKILEWIKPIQSKHVLVIFDDCYSGAIFQTRNKAAQFESVLDREIRQTRLGNSTNKITRQFITAGDSTETAPAHSLVMEYFLEALSGAADFNKDGYLTGTEISLFIQEKAHILSGMNPQFGEMQSKQAKTGNILFSILPPDEEESEKPPELARLRGGQTVAMEDLNHLIVDIGVRVHYEYDHSNLQPAQIAVVKQWANWMEQHPNVGALLEAHMAANGTREYDLGLAEREADAGASVLRSEQIPSSRFVTVSYGKERLADQKDTGANNMAAYLNRRLLFVPVSQYCVEVSCREP